MGTPGSSPFETTVKERKRSQVLLAHPSTVALLLTTPAVSQKSQKTVKSGVSGKVIEKVYVVLVWKPGPCILVKASIRSENPLNPFSDFVTIHTRTEQNSNFLTSLASKGISVTENFDILTQLLNKPDKMIAPISSVVSTFCSGEGRQNR